VRSLNAVFLIYVGRQRAETDRNREEKTQLARNKKKFADLSF
jgi:hypothetical protein